MSRLALGIATAASTALIWASPASAASITVTSSADENAAAADNGTCTLREAISAANTNAAVDTCVPGQASGDTISFSGAVTTVTISIASTNEALNADGDFDVVTGSPQGGPLLIDGGDDVTVNGGGVDRVFDLVSGANALSLENLTVTGGIPANLASGGGLRTASGTTAVLSDTDVDMNGANNVTAGGGIASGGSLEISGGRVFGNLISGGATSNGAGILASGPLTIDDSEVSFNTAAAGSSRGGGIAAGGQTTISDTQIVSNTASDAGGGIHLSGTGAAMDLTRVTIDLNQVLEGGNPGGGGGVSITGSGTTTTISDSVISDNTAGLVGPGGADNVTASGGGIDFSPGAAAGLTISDSLVDDNQASTRGGGIALSGASSLTVRRTAVTRNDVVDFPGTSQGTSGGGISSIGTGSAAIEDTEITSNTVTAEAGQGANAGGVRLGPDDSLERVTVAFNSLSGGNQEGGGIHTFGGPVTIENTTITQNSAPAAGGDGGGLHVTDVAGAVALANVTVTQNDAPDQGRGINRAAGASSSLSVASSIVNDGCAGAFTDEGGNRQVAGMAQPCGFANTVGAPQLLADNGGLTDIGPLADRRPLRTQAISFATGLVNAAGSPCTLGTDARGIERPAQGGCDPGAYELAQCDGTDVGATSIIGSGGTETLTGTASGEIIYSQSGDDTVDAGGGNDRICGGPGDDTLNGQADPDRIDPGPGADVVDGAAGASDTVTYLEAPEGVDVDLGAGTADTGASGQDTLTEIEDVTGSRFEDELTGSSANNLMLGSDSDDVFSGGSGAGPDGNDAFFGGNDGGIDTVDYSTRADALTISLAGGTGGDTSGPEGDTLSSIENATAGSGADQVFGTTDANSLTGGPGADTINADEGPDQLFLRDGVADTISCGADNGNPDVDTVQADAQGVDSLNQCQFPPDVVDFFIPPVITPDPPDPPATPPSTPKKCKKGQKRKKVKGKVKCVKKKRKKK